MATIADALGMTLPEPEDRGSRTPAAHEGAAPAAPVLDALEQESGRSAHAIDARMTLAGDLDLDALGLYAVVTPAERALHVQVPDERIQTLRTVADLLQAFGVEGYASSSPA